MSRARAVLDLECLATNDSISGFTISGFSSYKLFLQKYNKKSKDYYSIVLPSCQGGVYRERERET